jgi:hypothetical protein
MVFKVQPSNKGRKKGVGRRMKQGSSFAAHQQALADIPANAEGELDPSDDDTGDALPPVSRKDNSWRSNRAVKSAKRATAKAIAERDLVIEDHAKTKNVLNQATDRLHQVQHERYVDKKASRVISLKTEEDHMLAILELHDKYQGELQVAHKEVGVETAKRLLVRGRPSYQGVREARS